ncbi:MAG TPA: hypothetical protein VMZ74_14925 [Ramlibacter sp.]|nr:hypothetical protein [Ramlibacter sp.]
MTKSSPSDTKQEHAGQEWSMRGEASEHGQTGEGAASAFAHMISQDQKHRKQILDPDEPSATSGHP